MSPLHIHPHYLCWDSKNCASFSHANPSQLEMSFLGLFIAGLVMLYKLKALTATRNLVLYWCGVVEATFPNRSLTRLYRLWKKSDTILTKRRWNRAPHLVSLNENLYFIMLLYVKRCISRWMCARLTVYVFICLLSGGWCVPPARCRSCQDVEGEQPASGRVGSKAKGPSVISNASATSPSSGTMVTSQNLPPPSHSPVLSPLPSFLTL